MPGYAVTVDAHCGGLLNAGKNPHVTLGFFQTQEEAKDVYQQIL